MIYPNVEFLFRIQARWIAWGIFGIITVSALSQHEWGVLAVAWAEALAAWLYMAWVRGMLYLPRLPRVAFAGVRRASERGGRRGESRTSGKAAGAEDPVAAIDPLLDKIARHGIDSLTPEEHKKLEWAREQLLRSDQARRSR